MNHQMECTREINRLFQSIIKEMEKDRDFPINSTRICSGVLPLKSVRCLGQCKRNRYESKYQVYLNQELIKLAFQPSKLNAIKSVLVHEIIHTFVGCMNHGPNFKHYAMLANSKYDGIDVWTHATKLESEVFDQEIENQVKYVAKCMCCGATITGFRRTKFVKQFLGELNRGNSSYYCLCQKKWQTKEDGKFVTTYVMTKNNGIDLSEKDYILPNNLSTVAKGKYQELLQAKEESKVFYDGNEILLFDVTEESEEKEVACQGHSGTRKRKKNIEDITISLF